jgi:hypothetical protein
VHLGNKLTISGLMQTAVSTLVRRWTQFEQRWAAFLSYDDVKQTTLDQTLAPVPSL